MAEVLGVVASGLTLAQILAETLSCIQKVHDVCSSVRNFSAKTTEAVTELGLLGQVLQNLQKSQGFRDGEVESAVLRYCQQIAQDLEFVVHKIQSECGSSNKITKHWTPFKTYLRKESMDDVYRRLERAKTMLNLVISSQILIMQQKVTTPTTVADSSSVNASSDEELEVARKESAPQPPCSQVTKMYSNIANYWLSCFLGVYGHHSGVVRVIKLKDGETSISEAEEVMKSVILPSAWIRLRGVSITCMRRNLNWEYLFSPIRVVSDSSPIFAACREGDINEVRSLLRNSHATLQDTSEWGWSLLHIAAMHAQPELCRWLLENGCNSNIVDVKNGWTPLLAISALSGRTVHSNLIKKRKELGILRAPEVEYSSSRIQDVIRTLVEQGSYDPLDLSKTGWCALHEYSGAVGPFRYLIEQQQAFLVDFKAFITKQHNELAWSLADQYWKSSAELLLVALTNGLSPDLADPFQPAWNRYRCCTLLHIECQRLDRYAFSEYALEPSLQVIASYISKGANIHSQDSFGATPLDDILSFKGDDNEDHKPNILLQWMRLLHSLKLDLVDYFQQEESIHESGRIIHVKYHRPMIERKFSAKYESESRKILIRVTDVFKPCLRSHQLPGAWFEERGGFERDEFGRYVFRDATPFPEYTTSFEG